MVGWIEVEPFQRRISSCLILDAKNFPEIDLWLERESRSQRYCGHHAVSWTKCRSDKSSLCNYIQLWEFLAKMGKGININLENLIVPDGRQFSEEGILLEDGRVHFR